LGIEYSEQANYAILAIDCFGLSVVDRTIKNGLLNI